LGKKTHPTLQLSPLEKKEQSSAWSEGIAAHPMANAMGRPRIPSVWEGRLTQHCIFSSCRIEANEMHGQREHLLIPWLFPCPDPKSFYSGKWQMTPLVSRRNFTNAKEEVNTIARDYQREQLPMGRT